MGWARYYLHIDRHGSPLAVGHAQFFEQATHGTMLRHRPLFAVNDYLDRHRRLLTKKKPQRVACGYLCPLQTPVLHGSGCTSVQGEWRFPTLALPRSGSKGCHHCDSVTWSLSASHTPSGMAKHNRPPIYLQARGPWLSAVGMSAIQQEPLAASAQRVKCARQGSTTGYCAA